MQVETRLLPGKRLVARQVPGEPPGLTLTPGDHTVAIIRGHQPGPPDTFDLDLIEELYLEFVQAPPLGVAVAARDVLAQALYQCGTADLGYRSTVCEGTLRLTRWEPGVGLSGHCALAFSQPLVDEMGVGTVRLEVDF